MVHFGDDNILRFMVTFDDADGVISFDNYDDADHFARLNAGRVYDLEADYADCIANYRGNEE